MRAIFFLFLGVVLSALGIGEAYDVTETCQIVPNNTFIANPSGCANWALCLEGVPYYGSCNDGLLYDARSATCNYAANVTCAVANVTTMCAGLNAVYKANPTNCQSYCYCESGVTDCTTCPTGQIYDPTSISCVWPSTPSPCLANSPCELVPDDVFVQDTSNCSMYYLCMNGLGTAGACPNGLLYNAQQAICDYPQNVVCPSGSSSSSSSSSADTAGTVVDNSTICANLTSGQQFVSDGSTCQGYYFCSNGSSTAEPVTGICPSGSHFSAAKQECVSPFEVACPYNRCEGVSYTFVTALNTNCTEYDVCSNGLTKQNSEDSCPSDFPYFNEQEQACVASEPAFPVCA